MPEIPHYFHLFMVVLSEEIRIKMFYISLTIAAIQTDNTNQLFAEAVGTVNAERHRVSIFKIISMHFPATLLRKIITEKAKKASSPHAKKKKNPITF